MHAALLLLLAFVVTARPINVPPVRSISVQVLSDAQYQKLLPPPATKPAIARPPLNAPMVPLTAPATAPPMDALPSQASTPPATPVTTPAATPLAPDAMTTALHLFSSALLLEPASREVRATLPTLAPYERMTQLCNIEATEQIRHALVNSNPETVSASAFTETNLVKGALVALGAAYRSHHKWFAMTYRCTVRPDLTGVAEFQFSLGAPIPKSEWDGHDLIAIDEDDE